MSTLWNGSLLAYISFKTGKKNQQLKDSKKKRKTIKTVVGDNLNIKPLK